MPVEMKPVFSDSVAAIGYDPETGALSVRWKDVRPGKPTTSVYAGVTAEVAEQVMNAPSVGSAIHNFIKPNHQHRYGG